MAKPRPNFYVLFAASLVVAVLVSVSVIGVNEFSDALTNKEIRPIKHAQLAATSEEISFSGQNVISVVAENGRFKPNSFEFVTLHNSSISVMAKDRDYVLVIKDMAQKFTVKKGTLMEVGMGTLGVGEHSFTCGQNCKGVIRIKNEDD